MLAQRKTLQELRAETRARMHLDYQWNSKWLLQKIRFVINPPFWLNAYSIHNTNTPMTRTQVSSTLLLLVSLEWPANNLLGIHVNRAYLSAWPEGFCLGISKLIPNANGQSTTLSPMPGFNLPNEGSNLKIQSHLWTACCYKDGMC